MASLGQVEDRTVRVEQIFTAALLPCGKSGKNLCQCSVAQKVSVQCVPFESERK